MSNLIEYPPDHRLVAGLLQQHINRCPECGGSPKAPALGPDAIGIDAVLMAFGIRPMGPRCRRALQLSREHSDALLEWSHWFRIGRRELDRLGVAEVAQRLLNSGQIPLCGWTQTRTTGGGVHLEEFARHLSDCYYCVPRSGHILHTMGAPADDLLATLEQGWRAKSGYKDVIARHWAPSEPMAEVCPQGCDLEDIRWQSLLRLAPAHMRALCCPKHGFARLYVITDADAEASGWGPPNSGP